MGRHRKPISKHKQDGTFRPDRHSGPEPVIAEPTMPSGLSEASQDLWKRIVPQLLEAGVLTKCDSLALQLLCESYETYVNAGSVIAREGMYVTAVNKNGSEYRTEHPAAKVQSRKWKEIVLLCRQFGMTPSSRTGLDVSTGEPAKDPLAEFMNRGGRFN